jgi:nucleotide-binding universal stress UspA family protein
MTGLPPFDLDGCFVVGFDDSRASRRALKAAADAATIRSSPLVVLIITTPDQLWNDGLEDLYQSRGPARTRAGTTAARAVARIATTHPNLSVHVLQARDAQDDRVRALGLQAHLLVLGVRGAHGQRALTMGATSAEIARVFSCPVLIVDDGYRTQRLERPDEVATGRVVVGIDGRDDTDHVLAVAAGEALARERELVAVHSTPTVGEAPDHLTTRCSDALARLAQSSAASGRSGLRHRLVLTQLDPVTALVTTATPADLLVVGTRGGGRLAGLVTGSVSRAVFSNAPCDVLVVRTSASDRLAMG